MRGKLLALALIGLAGSTSVRADGLLIPTDRGLPPLSLTYQRVEVTIVGQVATTKVEQSYHNSTDRDLEAEYIFPLPPGASVRDFSMWVGGKRYQGEAVDASKRGRPTKTSSAGSRTPACSNTSAATSGKCGSTPSRAGASRRSRSRSRRSCRSREA